MVGGMKDTAMVAIDSIKPYEKNAKKHPESQIKKLAEIIQEFGFKVPILVDSDFVIIAGHGRLLAAKHLGLAEVPVNIADDLTPQQIRAYRIADNKIAETDWDLELLETEIREIDNELLDYLGFEDAELEELLKDKENNWGDKDPDEIPEIPQNVRGVERGQIWQLGDHRMMCGDSTSKEDVERLMNGEKADMVFTDPPYGVSYQSNMRTKSEKFSVIENDDSILTEWFELLPLVSKGWVFIWTSWKVLGTWLRETEGIGSLTNMVIWDKGGGGIGDLKKTFSSDYEVALVFNRGAKLVGKRIGSVWSVGKDHAGDYVHPTQ
jgi:hypothetical protein